jgi:hypothetical protein
LLDGEHYYDASECFCPLAYIGHAIIADMYAG